MGDVEETLQELKAHREAGRDDEALTGAWQLFDAEPDNLRAKLLVISILYDRPELATPAKKRALHGLLSDPAVDPVSIEPAACRILREAEDGFPAEEPDATAYWLENDEFTQDLLKQAYITDLDLEAALTAMRRWLLLSDRWREFPRVTEALVAQAANNEGAWPFDDEERARLDANPSELIALAFRPRRPQSWGLTDFADPVTRAVAEQYEGWPFPAWTRVTVGVPKTLAATIKKYDPDGPDTIPAQPEILIAGCGTGYEAAQIAVKYPDAKITAIDISKASLNYAAERCAAAGLKGIEFRQLDLNRVSELGRQFDAVSCCGVLHHLPDPEAAWATLSNVVKPGGVMRVMVYSKIARLMVQGWRTKIAHLLDQPVDDDLLREVRRCFIGKARPPLSRDFYTLGGVHDLLLHRHEDPFDVARIRRNIERLGLVLIRFILPSNICVANYRRENPQDPLFRDYALWSAQERNRPYLFAAMYRFWCRKPLVADSTDARESHPG